LLEEGKKHYFKPIFGMPGFVKILFEKLLKIIT
jgi:hypothetical protein